jgi:hypothetical protein
MNYDFWPEKAHIPALQKGFRIADSIEERYFAGILMHCNRALMQGVMCH